jgi:hypothetical protein
MMSLTHQTIPHTTTPTTPESQSPSITITTGSLPNIYVCILEHGSRVSSLKRELKVQKPAFAGWYDNEMTLKVPVSFFELHDNYRFTSDATVLLDLAQRIPTGDTPNDNNNTDNTSPEVEGVPISSPSSPPCRRPSNGSLREPKSSGTR